MSVDMQNDSENDNQSDIMHVAPDRLAAFDHELLTTNELAHLARCDACRREHRAHETVRALAHAAAGTASIEMPRLVEWDALSVALRREGLIVDATDSAMDPPTMGASKSAADATRRNAVTASVQQPVAANVVPMRVPQRHSATWWRVAAAALVMASSAAVGRLTATMPLALTVGGGASAVGLASTVGATDTFGSVRQASDILYRAQRDYERASLWLAANDTTMHSSDVYRARLEALDQMMAASRAALREAPQDPVLNHYFLSAYNAREATLQALGGALPVDKTLERY